MLLRLRGYVTKPRDWCRAFVCLVLATFLAPSLIAQGHFHWNSSGLERLASAAGDLHTPDGKGPIKGDQSKCPICHAASVAGALAVPNAPALRVPALSTLIKPRDERAIVVERFAAHWRSRAPPAV